MSAAVSPFPPELARLHRAVQRRLLVIGVVEILPLVLALALVAGRLGGRTAAAACAALAIAVGIGLLMQQVRIHNRQWLVRKLNAEVREFEDSLELIVGSGPSTMAPRGLGALQRVRMRQRVMQLGLPDLRPPYPRRAFAWTWSGAALLGLLILAAASISSRIATREGAHPASGTAGAIVSASLRYEPPAYTGLTAQTVASLEAKVPAGSRLEFKLRLASAASHAALLFHDGSRLELQPDGVLWRGEKVLDAPALFRVQLDALPAEDRLHRIDVIPDRPPEVVVKTPERTLNVLTAGQKTWELGFEASDDYGLGPAELSISLAQGSGEQIKTTEQTVVLEGSGGAKHRAYTKTLDLAGLGFSMGDDLIVRLSVADNHTPTPNRTRSASFILRWPAESEALSEGMEGLVQKTLPAYFASERQLIIDSEALQGQRGTMDVKPFATHSDDLGIEQKVLRLRYGQFLGEEFESNAEHAPPGHENPKEGNQALKDVPPEHADQAAKPSGFGDEGNITSEFGHVHDKPEAATLLDPDTKRLLKAALDQMWQAELQLRQAQPDQALPYEYKALEYIKQVEQSERIYLARAGVELPQIDAGRRLTGDRSGLIDRSGSLPGKTDDSPVPALWQALSNGTPPDWAGFETWARAHPSLISDPLRVSAAADRLQRDSGCQSCRADLKAALWPLLPAPGTALEARNKPDAATSAYLNALVATPP